MTATFEWTARLRQWIRLRDLGWLALFTALAVVSPTRNDAEVELLTCLAILQVLEPKLSYFATSRGVVLLILLKLVLGFLLLGVTGGITSSYYLILILPVITAATGFGLLGTIVVSAAAAGCYFSFLLFLDPARFVVPADQMRELWLRVILLLGVVGFATHQLVEARRVQARRYQQVAEQLAEANRNLQAAEAEVRRSERLAALGQLMAGLAHELRNPLGTMRASAELLTRQIPKDDPIAAELAGYIAAEVDRTNTLITRFLEFARPVQLRKQPADLNALLDRAVTLLAQRQPPPRVSVHKNYSPDIPPIPLDVELMERVVFNLLLNAVEASPEGGAVTLKTRLIDGAVEIAVIDRGVGIDPAHRESIFNPFFTTKPEGVGMGLAIVSRIVAEHGGTMSVESEPGQGSLFRVLLPVSRSS